MNLVLTDANYYNKIVNNNVLLHRTGYYIQYLVITYNGKESKKRIHTHTYKTESLCCIPEINATL